MNLSLRDILAEGVGHWLSKQRNIREYVLNANRAFGPKKRLGWRNRETNQTVILIKTPFLIGSKLRNFQSCIMSIPIKPFEHSSLSTKGALSSLELQAITGFCGVDLSGCNRLIRTL
jgi:hypothetical protein